MYNSDWMLFSRALTEAAVRRYTKELLECGETAAVSHRHKKAMERILKNAGNADRATAGHVKWSWKKRLIVILVAAALLLAGGLAAFANRDAIGRFVEQIFDGFNRVTYQPVENESDAPEIVEQAYLPTYIPAGYELVEQEISLSSIWMEWQGADGESMTFEQGTLDAVRHVDNEHSTYETWTVGEYSVDVQLQRDTTYSSYLWSDGNYIYHIACNENLPPEEIRRMILSVAPAENIAVDS